MQQVRDDRDRQTAHTQALNAEIEKYREVTGKSSAEMDSLTTKVIAMEVCWHCQPFVLCPFR